MGVQVELILKDFWSFPEIVSPGPTVNFVEGVFSTTCPMKVVGISALWKSFLIDLQMTTWGSLEVSGVWDDAKVATIKASAAKGRMISRLKSCKCPGDLDCGCLTRSLENINLPKHGTKVSRYNHEEYLYGAIYCLVIIMP